MHISYEMVVHEASGRIVYKTRNKSGGSVTAAKKLGELAPFADVCFVGDVLQPDYVIRTVTLDDHETIDYETQRFDADGLRDATSSERAEYRAVVDRVNAETQIAADRVSVALIDVLASLHDTTAEALTDLVVAKLIESEEV